MNFPASLKNICRLACIFAASTGLLIQPLRADVVELINGDHYRGTVISMTQSTVDFQSEVQGRVKLPREKVATITLHESAARPSANVTTPPAGAVPSAPSAANAAPGNQADAVVQQMRQQGIDPKLIDQVQEQIFGKASP